jgi:lipopolysaccharide/colanic/teichoic acid biosynthesis glycosyltransferase
LLNVLKGDLSLVGPRPITELEQRSRYRRDAVHPHSDEAVVMGYWDVEGLRPGLTGYWQISGRSTMSFEERIRLDTAYLTNWSLSLDFAILLRTVRALFATRGAF